MGSLHVVSKNAALLTFLGEEPCVEDALYHFACLSLLLNMSRSVTNELVVSFLRAALQYGWVCPEDADRGGSHHVYKDPIDCSRKELRGRKLMLGKPSAVEQDCQRPLGV